MLHFSARAPEGIVLPCGWLHDRLYGVEAECHKDHGKIKGWMDRVGIENTNCFKNTLGNIVDGPWFKLIKESWTHEWRLERCSVLCGDKINLIGEQNKEIAYKV